MSAEEIRVHIVKEKDRANLSMRYVEPFTGKVVKKSAETDNRKEARKRAAQWEADLREGRYTTPSKVTWEEFTERYLAEKASSLAPNTADRVGTTFRLVERMLSPVRLRDVTTGRISRWQAQLRDDGRAEQTIASYSRHLKAALRWAADVGLLVKAPKVPMPKRAKGARLAKARPVTTEEFERMLQKVPAVVGEEAAEPWRRFLKGLWLSGLRLGEALALSWDDGADFAVDLSGKHPRFRIAADAQKSGKDELAPMMPDFAELLFQTPPENRTGPVFILPRPHSSEPAPRDVVSRTVTAIGKKAVVKVASKTVKDRNGVDWEVVKYASAHDLRRGFGTRWARKVMPAVLQRLMRHSAIQTTLGYYVDLDADSLAADLWRQFEGQKGTVSGTADKSPAEDKVDAQDLRPCDETTCE